MADNNPNNNDKAAGSSKSKKKALSLDDQVKEYFRRNIGGPKDRVENCTVFSDWCDQMLAGEFDSDSGGNESDSSDRDGSVKPCRNNSVDEESFENPASNSHGPLLQTPEENYDQQPFSPFCSEVVNSAEVQLETENENETKVNPTANEGSNTPSSGK